jgi:hydroxyacylglutathione hydrolase
VFLERFFEPGLAQVSYVIGCQATGEAIVIDPNRDVEQYVRAAAAEGTRVEHVTETHIHADFVSGSRELASRTGAALYLSDEGDAAWKYGFAASDRARLLRHGDRIKVGNVAVDAVHTPGHTPEHLTFLVTDGASATEPMGAATGDFIFVGDVGRPDLLERAVNLKGTMTEAARTLYRSLHAFMSRPDWLQVWPAHGAGSACGKGISSIPQSTLGYEKRFNWAFRSESEDDFVARVLRGQPDPPKYFAKMKAINRDGPPVLGGFRRPPRRDLDDLVRAIGGAALVVDTRRAEDFAVTHVPGTINIPQNASFTTWAGWLLPYDADFFVIVDERAPGSIDTIVRELAMIGLDRVAGYLEGSVIDRWAAAGRSIGTVPQIGAADLAESIRHRAVTLVDVRHPAEWEAGHIADARHVPLGYLTDHLGEIPRDKPVVVQCQSGNRSAIGASLLRRAGFDRVVNLRGGISGWHRAGLAVQHDQAGS